MTKQGYFKDLNDKKTKALFGNQNHGSYGALLFDKRWKSYRKKILNRDNNTCIVCNSKDELQAHHKQYHFSEILKTFKKPWEYPESVVITICKKCHQKGHSKYKVPIKYIK